MKMPNMTKSGFAIIAIIVLAVVTAGGCLFTGYLVDGAAQGVKKNVEDANLIISLNLINELKRIEGAAVAVAGSPLTLPLLQANTPGNMEKVNNILDRYHKSLDAAACYLIDSKGITLTSSNRHAKDSFVGQNYTFRPYFQQSVKGSLGRYFAYGTVSKKRGFFASAPVKDKEGRIVGVVAIKKELDDIEAKLNQYIWFLADQDGIIFLSSLPEAQLKSLWPLDKTLEEKIVRSKQYGPGPFSPVFKARIEAGSEVSFRGANYLTAQQRTPYEGVSVILIWPMQQISMARSFGIALTVMIDFLIMSFLATIYIFRRTLGEREHAAKELKTYADRLKARSELKTRITQISTEMQKSATFEEMAQKYMSLVVPLLGAAYGNFYVMDEANGLLVRTGGYGSGDPADERKSFSIGSGLVGQCAREKKPIQIINPQDDAIRITWGGGHFSPHQVSVLPVMSLDRVLGVIEMATLTPLDDDRKALFEELMPAVALNIEILQQNMKTHEFLEQSQNQALALAASERQLLARTEELEQQKEALAQTQEISRQVLGSTSEGILGMDRNGNATFVNPAAAVMLGYSVDELTGKAVHAMIHHSYPDGSAFPREDCPMYLSGKDGRSRTVDNEVLWRKDGTALEVEYSTTPIRKNGEFMGAVVSFHDISERRKLDAMKVEKGVAEEAAARAEQARMEAERAREELSARMMEIERFNRLSLGREERIIELKKQVNELALKADGKPVYRDHELTQTAGVQDGVEAGEAGEAAADSTQTMAEMLSVDMFKRLLEDFCDSVGIASAIIDLEGRVLAAARWQRACTDFHRVNEKTCARCIESDTELALKLNEGKPFSVYRCRNGLTDAASPIIVNGRHVANTFVGQFFTAPPDLGYFERQAEECGLDREKYLEAIRAVPIVAENRLESILGFLVGVAQAVATMSMERDAARRAEIAIARRMEESKRERAAAMSLAEDADNARAELEKLRDQKNR